MAGGAAVLLATGLISATGGAASAAVSAAPVTTVDAQALLPVERIAGDDRFGTSAAISAASVEPGVETLFIASGESFPDALAGAPLAGAERSAVLLTARDSLPDAVRAEIRRLEPQRIVVFGGTGTISARVADELQGLAATGEVDRLAGTDRFSTSAAISKASTEQGVPTVFVASGESFPDALSGAPIAGSAGAPVLLTARDSLPGSVRAELQRLKPTRIVLFGGAGTISDAVADELRTLATSGDVSRLAGADRYSTSAAISGSSIAAGAPVAFVASGESFPDALSGAPFAGLSDAPVLLTARGSLPDSVRGELIRLQPQKIVLFGGPGTISDAVAKQLASLRLQSSLAVSKLQAVAESHRVGLAWENPADAAFAGVSIRRSSDGTPPATPFSGEAVATLDDRAATSYVDETVAPGSGYQYSVFALDASGAIGAAVSVGVDTTGVAELSAAVTVSAGSAATVGLSEGIDRVERIDPWTSADGLLTALVTEGGSLQISASRTVESGETDALITGSGCRAETCGVAFAATISVSTLTLAEAARVEYAFTEPSADRVAEATLTVAGGSALADELLVTLGTDVEPGQAWQAESIAAVTGALVTASFEELGVYELRWPEPPADLAALIGQIASTEGVAEVSRSILAPIGDQALPPGDWNDDGQAGTWHLRQVRAPQAWDSSTGTDVPVGIVDGGTVADDHEDLNVASVLHAKQPDEHATHVAGLACAAANGKGVVGAAWGCPVTSIGLGSLGSDTDRDSWLRAYKTIFESAAVMAASDQVRVVNMSLGRNTEEGGCVSKALNDELNAEVSEAAGMFRRLFNGATGRDIVWTLSAGNNCGVGVHSPMGKSWALPNVISVAANNSDGTLAWFSNYGPEVEVSAGGGYGIGLAGGDEGVWSTTSTQSGCGLFGWFRCRGYGQMAGTSMAAPIVAGVAALVIGARPELTAAEVGSCIVSTAGTNTPTVKKRTDEKDTKPLPYAGSIPVVDAEAAVACAKEGPTGGDVLLLGGGDRTASGNGTDMGDLAAAFASFGRTVARAETMPDDLSGFGQIWYVDTNALSGEEVDRLVDYVAAGNGVYLTGEWGCCSSTDTSIEVINRVTTGGDVAFAGEDGNDVLFTSTGPKSLRTSPNAVNELLASSPGSLSGVAPRNTVGVADDPSRAVVAAWNGSDVEGGGKVAIVMDINWVAQQYRGPAWKPFVENLVACLD
ncbi:cell wall-binding repeat-containing protein [Herbiconiux sp. KACC 21604]|uniref:cell wall-binding repeat-containing protein n=1 Tax=unclassified Herbiconiux TaxID=2618217 RepID=UPI0014915611|nr:cell wall-binding repeat-containing protein [Herbiconiux sp. SALV-R1]QJU52817.1 S8 family serine peptidase [Herbiconiux sp. SALV-R1]WPO87730.1 cell wall-binding repeat-containing protein [Herbiconiux sp. KACC 21604]